VTSANFPSGLEKSVHFRPKPTSGQWCQSQRVADESTLIPIGIGVLDGGHAMQPKSLAP